MKKVFVKLAIISLAVLFYGCPNNGPYEMYTKINADGSCYREFIQGTDSAFVAGDTSQNPFPMKLDSSWTITFYKRLAGDTTRFANMQSNTMYNENGKEYAWFATAVKEYKSVSDMAKTFRFDDSQWDSVHPMITLNKRFRWFYTWYEFRETYHPVNPFHQVPISEYLTENEIGALYGEDRELFRGMNGFEIKNALNDLEKKADNWFNRSIYEELYNLYIKHFERFSNAPIDAEAFAMEKDTIFKYYIGNDSLDILEDDFNEILDHHFHTNVFTDASDDDFDKILESEFPDFTKSSGVELNYKLSLPGKITETNAPFLNHDTLSWMVEDDRFYFTDYTLLAISRKANYWAFAITGILIALTILGFLVRRK